MEKITTAKARNIARDYEDKLDWTNATKYYQIAIDNYPKFTPDSALHVADYKSLQNKLTRNLYYFENNI
jgi:hypothetical protein